MSHAARKAALDCQGEMMEAATNVPLMIMTHNLTDDDEIEAFFTIRKEFVDKYRAWKETLS